MYKGVGNELGQNIAYIIVSVREVQRHVKQTYEGYINATVSKISMSRTFDHSFDIPYQNGTIDQRLLHAK